MTLSWQPPTDTLLIEVVDRVGVIRFNRPDRRNALHDDMYAPIIEAIEAFAEAPDVGCVVLTGVGTAFCSGGDVRDGSGRRTDGTRPSDAERAANLAANGRLSVVLREAPIVTIAAMNGPAVGAGLALALACDLRIAATSATCVGGWARLAFSGDFGGAWLLAHRIGHAAALEFLALNRTVTASDALVLGLVDRVVDDDNLETTWRTLAAGFAAGPKAAIGLMKANLNDAIRLSLGDAIRVEAERMVASSRTQDHREAVRAWVERRDPRFGPATEHD